MACACYHWLDIFKRPIYLHLNSREKNSSKLGFLFSLGIYVLIVLEFIKSDIFHYSSPKVFDQPITENLRQPIVFSDKVFTISIVDDNSKAYQMDPSLFQITAKNVFYSATDDGGFKIDEVINKPLHLCTVDDFHSDPNVFFELGLNNSYCLEDNSFQVGGYWDEPRLVLFSIEVSLCNNILTEQCSSTEEIQKFFSLKYFNLVFADLKIDYENHTMPLAVKYTNQYKLIDPMLNKMMNIFLKQVEVTTEDGLIFSNEWNMRDIGFESLEVDFSVLRNNNSLNLPIFTCDFYAARSYQKITRTYEKISEVFSSIGGLLSFFMIWGFLFTYVENTLSLTVQIMNRLYSFQPESTKEARTLRFGEARKPLMHESPPKSGEKREKRSEEQLAEMHPIASCSKIMMDENFLDKTEGEEHKIESMVLKKHVQVSTLSLDFPAIPSLHIENPGFRHFPHTVKEEPAIEENESPEAKKKKKKKIVFSKSRTVQEYEMTKRLNEIERGESEKSEKEKPRDLETKMSNSGKSLTTKKITKKGSLGNINFLAKKKSTITNEFKKFQTLNNNNLQISFWEYFKFNLHKIFRCFKRGFKEELFLKAQSIYEREIDIVYILQRLQEIEKLKLVLLNDNQVALFNLMAKPMVYIEKFGAQKSGYGGFLMSERLSATLKKENLKSALDHYEKSTTLTEVDRRLFHLLDENIQEFKKYFEEK